MSKSLQDQLLALGLANEPAKKPQRPKKHQSSRKYDGSSGPSARQPNGRGTTGQDDISLEQAYRIREKEEQASQAQKRLRKIEEDRKRAALNKAIKQIIDAGRLNRADAAEARYFMFKNRIRKVYVTPEQLEQLNSGELGVVYLSGGYHLLEASQVEAVKKLSSEHVPDLQAGGDDEESGPEQAE